MGQRIDFEIGSTFSGEGFKAAQAATTTLNTGVRNAASQMTQITSALGGMDNAVGKAASAMTGMLTTFMTLNPVMIGITAAISALTFAYNEHKKGTEELKKWTDDLKESMAKMADASNASFTDAIITRIRNAERSFEQITKHANDMTAAMNGLANAQAQGGVIALQAEKLQAVMNQATEEARQLTAAEYDLRIATEKAAVGRLKAQQQVEAAQEAITNTEKEIWNLEIQRASAINAVKIMEERIAENKKNGLANEENDNKRLSALRNEIANIDARTVAAKNRLEVEVIKEQTAAANLANATAAAKIEIDTAAGKISDLKAATEAAVEAEKKATEEKEAQTAKLKEQREIQEAAAKAQKEANDAAKDVAAAERSYAQALAEYEKNYADNKFAESIFGDDRKKGLSVPVRIDGAIKAEVVSHDLEKAINDGLIRSVKDMDKFNRDRAKQLQDDERQKWAQIKEEKRKYDELTKEHHRTWSKADKDFVEKFEKLRDTALAHKQAIEDAKKDLQMAKQRERDNHQNLADIKKKLENLGLK